MNNLQFSVVIPLYNKEKHIIDAINSVLLQSLPAQEVIVVDDGSTDTGAAKVAALADPRVKLISQQNQGVSAARNNGIAAAQNEYIAFLDADDIWLPFFLEEMYHLILRYPQSGYYASRYQCVDGDDKYTDAKIALDKVQPYSQLMDNYFATASKGDLPFMVSSSVVSKKLLNQIGGFPIGEKMGEDQDFFARAAMATQIAYSPNINLLYRRDSDNKATHQHTPKQECPFSQRLELKRQQGQIPVAMHTDVVRYSAAHICDLAKKQLHARNPVAAMQLLSDPRCRQKPLHRLAFSVWALCQLPFAVLSSYNIVNKSNAIN